MQINGAKLRHRLHRSFDKIAQPKELLTPQNDYIYGNNPGKPSGHPESLSSWPRSARRSADRRKHQNAWPAQVPAAAPA